MPPTEPVAGPPAGAADHASALLAALDRVVPPAPHPRRGQVLAAVAVGDRLRASLAWEWAQRTVTPEGWRAVLAESSTEKRPDLLLVEVVNGRVPGWGAARAAGLADLVSGCRAASIPVVVWVTAGEDAPELAAPLAADHVFVSDPAAVQRWRDRYPDSEVSLLPPAAQPRLHHPGIGGPGSRRELGAALVVDPGGPGDGAAEALSTVVDRGVQRLGSAEFDIWGTLDPAAGAALDDRDLPPRLRRRVVGTQPYEKIPAVIGRYRVLVDAGRADPAASWSLLEAGAAQTSVVTVDRQRAELPSDLAAHVAGADEATSLRGEVVARICQPELRDREALRLHRAVLTGHTYEHRVDQILRRLGRQPTTRSRTVSAVVSTNREHEIANVLENAARQAYPETELVVVLHGLHVKHREIRAQAQSLGLDNLTLVDAEASATLGACMNLGIDAAGGAYVAKMDDDNFYAAHFLTDLVAAFDYTEAGVVGKWTHYVWLRATDAVVLRNVDSEHRYERRVQGGSMIIDGDLARGLRFADLRRAVDTDFLERAMAEGVKIYSADRFNFVSVRGADPRGHTWQAADVTFMTGSGRLTFFGDPRGHVDV